MLLITPHGISSNSLAPSTHLLAFSGCLLPVSCFFSPVSSGSDCMLSLKNVYRIYIYSVRVRFFCAHHAARATCLSVSPQTRPLPPWRRLLAARGLLSHRYAVLRYPVAGADVVASPLRLQPRGQHLQESGSVRQTSSPFRWIDAATRLSSRVSSSEKHTVDGLPARFFRLGRGGPRDRGGAGHLAHRFLYDVRFCARRCCLCTCQRCP